MTITTMSLNTVTDFDFAVGPDLRVTQRVSFSPQDVSKAEVDFIVWLMLEQEFRKRRRRQRIAIQQKQQRKISRRSQYDGPTSPKGNFNEDEEDDDEDDGDEPDHSIIIDDSTNEKLRIAREYAEETLRSNGNDVMWQDMEDTHREAIVLQLCKNSELLGEKTAIMTVPEIFSRLRTSKFRSQFNVRTKLAQGGFGEVFLVTKENDSTCQQYAVKKITPAEAYPEDVKAAITESQILKRLKGHVNIVEIHDYWLEIESPHFENTSASLRQMDEENEEGPLKFYIQLEYCSPSLESWKENNYKDGVIPEKSQILRMALQIFSGLAYIHKHGFLHLDINPKNILWKDDTYTNLKIVDFGLAVHGLSHTSKVGTPCYIAPELPLTQKSDVYSAAVTIVEVAMTIYTKVELSRTIQGKEINIGIPGLDDFLIAALDEDPEIRPTALDILQGLSVIQG